MSFRILFVSMFIFPLLACAQQTQVDSIAADTVIRQRFVPTGLRIGTDVISLVKTQRQDNFEGWEVSGDIDIHRYILSMDYGKWGRNFGNDSSGYRNDGRYWRVGIDANFLTRDPERNAFFLGLRYARSKYSERMSVIGNDSIFGGPSRNYANEDLRARWLELTAGLKVKIWKFIWFGYTGSLKLGLKKDASHAILSHDIPGYGNTERDTNWGFTYHLYFRIPFRETTPILPPKKKKK